jgi:rare lipoprotein A
MASRAIRVMVLLVATLSTAACVSPRTVPTADASAMPATTALAPADEPAPEPTFSQVGNASWYGRFHQGRKTASGDRFNMNALTAAHRTLPLGTEATVTNLENGRSVDVVVNDRGPYMRGRIIDLSRRAAEKLGMKEQGVAKVRVEVVPKEDDVETAALPK